ncbi:MAG: hypothetical protein WCA36_16825 [Pseudolabrys sp.]
MERCRDYLSFAVWFAGIGYAVLWPFAALGSDGRLFGASVLCGGSRGGAMAALCGLPHPLSLPFGLHVMGLAAAMTVAARLSCRLLRRQRAHGTIPPAAVISARLAGALPVRPPPAPTRRLRTVKPRKHFGLRGTPH